MKITRQNQSCFAYFVRRGIMLMALLIAFVVGARAEKYYVIYYDDENGGTTTRHYLSISEDGNSVVDATTLSNHSIWFANDELSIAVGNKGESLKGTTTNTTNETNRKSLFSRAFPQNEITDPASGVTETAVNSGTEYAFRVNAGASKPRWLMDNEIPKTPIVYRYYRKQYVYYDGGWKFSSKGYETHQSKLATIEEYSLFPPYISNAVQNDDGCTISLAAAEGEIYYTTDGSIPTSSSNKYDGPFIVDNTQKIKAIAIEGNERKSIVVDIALPGSLTVILDDREDHSWTYYSGIDPKVDPSYDPSIPGSGYNNKYKGTLYSPNPRDVMITYDGNGGTVSIYEPEKSFIYYKTLEQGATEDQYPYTVISNPFSKRPIVDGRVQGFGGWKIISGGEYIKDHKDNDILSLDEEIVFKNLKDDKLYKIKFEATWINANIQRSSSGLSDEDVFSGGTYETNILVLDYHSTSIEVKYPCTITMVEPDGSVDYRGNYTLTGTITPVTDADKNTKIEYTHWKPAGAIDALGRNLTIGRGMIMDGTASVLYGTNTATNVDQIFKVESGVFSSFTHYGKVPTSIVKQWITFGCDYDRATNDNSKLEITGRPLVASEKDLKQASGKEICRVYSLSGKFLTSKTVSEASRNEAYYMCVLTTTNKGYRYLEIQGGEWVNIAGGMDKNTSTDPGFTFRMKGGHIKGSVYGAAEYLGSSGTRVLVITGGEINGWVAGGANGTRLTGGDMSGASYVYVGGNARVDSNPDGSEGAQTIINRAVGGNVFGAGCGYCNVGTSGEVTLGSNVVIADNAYVERGVYGGGSYGYTEALSNIYITGGTIGANVGGVNATPTGGTVNSHAEYSASYSSSIHGGVYGGACQNKGGSVNIYMTGGMVNGGLYGGSNASGTLSGNVNVKITGGTIGGIVNGNQANANVYGGGYGSGTAVNGAVSMTLGNSGASTGATVNGDVYGGGAEGKVNNSILINVNAANINGDLYGGGHGASAEVSGNSAITMTGGTIGNVFGGGNAAKLIGNSSVTITDGTVTSNVYGGGNQAEVKGQTKVVVGKNR